MPDPWLTNDGEPHPAAEPLPEWKAEGLTYRLRFLSELACWRIEYCDPDTEVWYLNREITAHEAAALLEMDKREKLAKRGISVNLNWRGRWVVHANLRPRGQADLYLHTDGTWRHHTNAAEFDSYTAAIQAAALAEKGKDNGKE